MRFGSRREGDEPRFDDAQQAATAAALAYVEAGETREDLAEAIVAMVAGAKNDFGDKKGAKMGRRAVAAAILNVTSDDVITEPEDLAIRQLMWAYQVSSDDLTNGEFDAWSAFLIARMNSGRMPDGEAPEQVMLRPGEVCYGTVKAYTENVVTTRTYSSGYSGISVPLGLGIRVSTGSSRGRVHTHKQVKKDDTGLLIVTSARTIFLGTKSTIEVKHSQLVGLVDTGTGLAMNVSGRTALVRVEFPWQQAAWVPVFAAMIANAQRLTLG
jgi:hypothetical protein